jgi:hypothetical protein
MKATLGILLMLVPFLSEYAIDSTRTLMNKRHDKHLLTGSIRVVLIILVGLANPMVLWWQQSLLAFAFHYMVFDFAFNAYVLDRPIWYLGNNWIDRVHQEIQNRVGFVGLTALKLMVLITGIKFYVNPCIQWDCIWSF